MLCIGPCFGLIGLISMIIYLSRSQIHYKHILICLLAMGVSFFIGLQSDSFARETIFRLNYLAYRTVVKDILRRPPPKSYGKSISKERLRGFGIYGGSYETVKDIPVITLDTSCGPSLETVAYSPKPIKSSKFRYEFKRKDDLGYWYFVQYK